MPIVQRRVRITGRVQGVYFRADLRRLAQEMNLRGWVRNRFDGRVEAVVHGEEEQVLALLRWCQHGPPGARVTDVEVRDEPPERFHGFSILPTE